LDNASFYSLSIFERQIVLYYLNKVLESIKNSEKDVDEIIGNDEEFREVHQNAVIEIQDYLLNEANLPLLDYLMLESQSEEVTLNEDDYTLIAEKFREVIDLFKINPTNKLQLSLKADNRSKKYDITIGYITISNHLLNFLKGTIAYGELNTNFLLNRAENFTLVQFTDLLLSYLVVELIFKTSNYRVRLVKDYFVDENKIFNFSVLNFFHEFILNEERKKKLEEILDKIGKNYVRIERIKGKDDSRNYYFFDCKLLGSLAKELYEKFLDQQIQNTGFGFAKSIKLCSERHGWVEEDIYECAIHKVKLHERENVFLIYEKCYKVLNEEEYAGNVLEQYVYLMIRGTIVRNSLNFIISRNIQFIVKGSNSENEDSVEFDIICIPAGDLFKKILIVECKHTCNNDDVSKFKNNIKKVFGENNTKYIYPAVVFLNSKVENRAQGESDEVTLYSVNEIERLIEDYIKASIQ